MGYYNPPPMSIKGLKPKRETELPVSIHIFTWIVKGQEVLWGWENTWKFRLLEYRKTMFRSYTCIKYKERNTERIEEFATTIEEHKKIKEELYEHVYQLAIIQDL